MQLPTQGSWGFCRGPSPGHLRQWGSAPARPWLGRRWTRALGHARRRCRACLDGSQERELQRFRALTSQNPARKVIMSGW